MKNIYMNKHKPPHVCYTLFNLLLKAFIHVLVFAYISTFIDQMDRMFGLFAETENSKKKGSNIISTSIKRIFCAHKQNSDRKRRTGADVINIALLDPAGAGRLSDISICFSLALLFTLTNCRIA